MLPNNAMPSPRRYVVALGLASLSIPEKFSTARNFVQKMTGNALFPQPVPELKAVSDAAKLLDDAWVQAQDGSTAETQAMYQAELYLENLMRQLSHYVEDLANFSSNPREVIESAGMGFKIVPVRTARVLTVRPGKLKGTATAFTRSAGKKASYIWKVKLKTESAWTLASTTVKTTYIYTGLTRGSAYEFRVAVVTNEGQGNWSDPIELIAA